MNCKQLICLKGNYNFGCHVHAIFVALIHTSIQRFSLFWTDILLPDWQMLFSALQKKVFYEVIKIINTLTEIFRIRRTLWSQEPAKTGRPG